MFDKFNNVITSSNYMFASGKIVHTVSGREFSLAEIRKDPLQRMHKLGLLWDTNDMTETEASKFAERRGRDMGK